MYILVPISGILIMYTITEMAFQTAALKGTTFFFFETDTNTYDFFHTTLSALREF